MTQGTKDKVMVITGASSGLGEATARYLRRFSGSVLVWKTDWQNVGRVSRVQSA
jgi:NADP-dependent 3-hydroxy acid dehydrogenase YdfG